MRRALVPLVLLLTGASPPIALSTSKLLGEVPGDPQRTNSFPTAAATSPDGRWVAVLANGFGTSESGFHESIALYDRSSGKLVDQPDERFGVGANQTWFLGLAFSSDGHRLYASAASLSDPTGTKAGDTGNGVAIYDVVDGKLVPSGFLKVPLTELPAGHRPVAPPPPPSGDPSEPPPPVDATHAVPYPAGLAVVPGRHGDRLLIAENLADDAILLDPATGAVTARFDLTTHPEVPAAYPYGAIVDRKGKKGWISLWNGSAVVELDLRKGKVERRIPLLTPSSPTAAGSHPTALALSPNGKTLYVALANSDAVAAIDARRGTVTATWSTRLPGTSWGGTIPNALAVSPDGKRLYVADAAADAVAVFDTAGHGAPLGFVPTEWYPTALAAVGDELFVVTGKGRGTGPNSGPGAEGRKHPYIASLVHGSLARVRVPEAMADLPALTAEVATSNRVGEPEPQALPSAIRHAVYIIRENRTFDQILGDLGTGDGDPSLILYGSDITPNAHAIARQYGVLDRFQCSGEVSGNGHVWSTAATTSDYTEKTWPITYGSGERNYDFEGEVEGALPLEAEMPDVDEPGTGYLWANAERNGVTHRNYGEFVVSRWCDDPATGPVAALGTPIQGDAQGCAKAAIAPGEALPDGTPNPWPWSIPMLARNVPTKAELRDHFDPAFADFRLDYPDVMRADEFLRELHGWEQARVGGAEDPMPRLVVLRLPNDHTSGKRPGFATPSAAVADNDLALGKIVAGISAGPYWSDTAIFVVEDDAQDGPDHVDAHRSPVLVVSRFAPHAADGPFVDSTDYTTVSVIRTIELLLGLPPMNTNDALAPVMSREFSGPGDAPPFAVDARNLDNKLIYQMNPPAPPDGGSASLELDFSHADSADSAILNQILWDDRHPGVPMPEPRR